MKSNYSFRIPSATMRAIETTGILNTQGQIQLDCPLPQDKPSMILHCVGIAISLSEDANHCSPIVFAPL
jgi:hypothetical protein